MTATATTDLVTHYINGTWTTDWAGLTNELRNPATGQVTGRVALAGLDEVDRAVAAARAAFETYSHTTIADRVAMFSRIAAEFTRRAEDMAIAVTTDMGIPIAGSRIAVGAAILQFTSMIDTLPGYPFHDVAGDHIIDKDPVGVAALIPPWNYPSLQMAEKVAPALAAGCTVILKPAEIVSHAGEVFAQIMDAAGVPAGVFNLLVGKGSTVGTALSKHPGVDMVAFTGSTDVGIQVQKDAADTVKRVSQELGGKSAHIVLPDADLDLAVTTAVNGVMSNSGQTCAAPTRTLVPAPLLDDFLRRVKSAVDGLTVGDPMKEVDLGPVANQTQWHTVQDYIQIGLDEGATLITGGPGKPDPTASGWYVRPTVFADVTNNMRIAREEIFGPVMSVITYTGIDDAIRIANDSEYGLAGYVTGEDTDQAKRVAARIRAGQVVVNAVTPNLFAPFGGYKHSGNGRIWGTAGLEEYLETKAIVGQI
ncbi:Putative aldehyde dehydrogenase [Propionicimonas sp. T2.31MG-18]|uniref:aldehyde dehydrogenase family protein n=1 Tax=Propionicimonas sp. T2.31MG-18 TaxID=3157620 RepID=UPI0035E53CD3